jgi:protein-S-isoprenylcysteine O-methyltransferase Ste14
MSNIQPIKLWFRSVFRMVFFAVALLWPAGTWYWWEAWVVIAFWSIYGFSMTAYLLRHDTDLLLERLKFVPVHQDQKSWDKVIMLMFFVAGISLYLVPGFDVVRFSWSEPLPLWVKIVAMVIHVPCFVLLAWVMRENTYLSQVVKIDEARGHQVITTGPYAVVRHPMYTIVIVLLFATPVALGSRYALILSVLLSILLIVRTYLEDCTLHEELDGYVEYAEKTRYRLLPGIW